MTSMGKLGTGTRDFLSKAQEEGQDLEDAFFAFYDRKETNG